MQQVKILVVEDELLIAKSLKVMLEELGYLVPGIFRSGTDLLLNFQEGMADIIFMDISLANGTNGIETARILSRTSNIPIVYMTQNQADNVRKKAIFETNAAYYLHKPFNLADVDTAIDLTLKFLKREKAVGQESPYLMNDAVFIREDFSYKKIRLADIILLKAERSYFQLQCLEKTYLFSENLSFFDDKLLFAKELVRVHRSYIVNTNYIDKIQENRIWVAGREIPIGSTYKTNFFEKVRFI